MDHHEPDVREFHRLFGRGGQLWLASAPGRTNLIGEHTDYNDGYVLPMAIDRRIAILCRARRDRACSVYSQDFDARVSFHLDELHRVGKPLWPNYLKGVADVLQKAGHALRGFDAMIHGDVPIGAGLSSSAAIELATAMAFCVCGDLHIDNMELAKLCQRAENEFVGMHCGIMDQFIAVHGMEGHAVMLDCKTMAHEYVPLRPQEARIVLCNTGVKHELAASAYNQRRAQCEAAIAIIGRRLPGVTSYHDLTPDSFAEVESALDGELRMRARHVVTENARVLASVEALKDGRLDEFGECMNASHESLRADYEVSCVELDLMVRLARETDGTLGARLTGAGFGGCTVNLVRREAVERFCETVPVRYRERSGREAAVYVVDPAAGAAARRVV